MATFLIAACQCPCLTFVSASAASPTPTSHPLFRYSGGGSIIASRQRTISSCNSSRPSSSHSSATPSLSNDASCCHHKRIVSAPFSLPLPVLSSRRRTLLPCPRADLDSDTITAISVALVGIAFGIGIPIFYETQVKQSTQRENTQPCFPCAGSGSQVCRFCLGDGDITVELGRGEKEVSRCINCEGAGSITCTTCQGSGVQPRYLDRREYKDED